MIGAAASGRVDVAGALATDDPRLHALQVGAGGRPGGTLAVPGLAAVARLAGRLQIAVSRPVLAADGERTLDLWVRAAPDRDGIALEVSGWAERAAPRPEPAPEPMREEDFLRADADWRWEVDGSLTLTAVSPAAAGALPGPPEEAIGQTLTRLFSLKEDADGALPLLTAVAAGRRFDGQLAAVRGGSGALFRLSGVPMADGQGRFAGFRGAATRAGEAEAPEAAVPGGDGLGASLDAAIREPLSRIVGAAEALGTSGPGATPQYADYATDIASAGRHLLSLVDDLADMSAIEHPDFRPDAEPVDLVDAARRAAGLLRVRAADRDVQLAIASDTDRLSARGDFHHILQILVNLLGNAVRYAPRGGTIRIEIGRRGNLAILTVADDGEGIAPEDHERIFEKFERVDPSEPDGTGLGLYISRRLARAMGGDIAVDSAPGQGARFTLTLPLA